MPAQNSSLQHHTFAELRQEAHTGADAANPGRGFDGDAAGAPVTHSVDLPATWHILLWESRRGTSGSGWSLQCRDQGTDPPATADAAMEPIGLENQRNSSHVWPSMLFSNPSSVAQTGNLGVDLDASLSPNPSTSIIEHRHFYLLRISAISYLHSQSPLLWSIYYFFFLCT